MSRSTPESSGSRLKQIIGKLDEKEGRPPSAEGAAQPPPPAPPAPPTSKPAGNPRRRPTARAQTEAAPRADSGWESFKGFAILFSFIVNVIFVLLFVVVIAFAFQIKKNIAGPLIGGLYGSFVQMDAAHIQMSIPVNTTIQVNDTMPVVFDLPLQQNTNVILSENTLITGASVTIAGGVLQLNNAPTTIFLPKGTVLPVTLNLTVPVSQTVPVSLSVPINIPVAVDIPLDQTELHEPFSNLRDLFAPYYNVVSLLPDSWGELVGLK